MMGANADFAAFMDRLNFQAPQVPLYLNATAAPESNPEVLRASMGAQLISSVRWAELIVNLKAVGIDTWVEVGPKNVLTGLVRKILPQEPKENFHNVENRESLEKFLAMRQA
jgi:[acyl-carrier-protein] S-malonyltransferase